ncbi:hypothetical protein AMST5_00827 [freshwater sediment metagenome]|uniref:Uncharacterized protein n=1 Tax=freshwater sediment metagenome TaxID=556182 RepID=A0AA48LZS2_9ZZZZ
MLLTIRPLQEKTLAPLLDVGVDASAVQDGDLQVHSPVSGEPIGRVRSADRASATP